MTETTVAGLGWERLAGAVAGEVPPDEVDGIWLFAPLRRGPREWGTAIISRIDGDRRRIYTARYVLAIKGKERGKFEPTVQEVGSGPIDALASLLHEANARIDDEHPPVPVAPSTWFPDVGGAAPGDAAVGEASPDDAAAGDASPDETTSGKGADGPSQ